MIKKSGLYRKRDLRLQCGKRKIVVKQLFKQILFIGYCFVGQGLLADEVFKPPMTPALPQIPPSFANISANELKHRNESNKKEFEAILKEVLLTEEKNMSSVAKDLSEDSAKLNRFLFELASYKQNKDASKKDLADSLLLSDLNHFLLQQYDDLELLQKKVTLTLKNANICDAIGLIGKSTGLSFLIDNDVKGRVKAIHFSKISVAKALRTLLQSNKPELALIKDNDLLRIVCMKNAKKIFVELQEKDFECAAMVLHKCRWNKKTLEQIEKMWRGTIGKNFGKDGFYLVFDEENQKVFFRGRQKHVKQFKKFLNEINCDISQVRIEARFVCAEKGFEENIGFQWSGVYNRRASVGRGFHFVGAGRPLSDISNNPQKQTQESLVDWALNFLPTPKKVAKNMSIPLVFGDNDLNTKRLNLVLNAAENKNEIKTILQPTVLTNDKEMAEILVGENLPIETIVEESVEGRLRNVRTANYKDIGIQLKVRPTVSPDKQSVTLDVFIENSLQSDSVTTTQSTYPVIRTTRSKTSVRLYNGQTTMISGLIKEVKEQYNTKAPLLRALPLFGWLFKGKRKVMQDMQLLIFITPTIL